jgi:hypothetical protein
MQRRLKCLRLEAVVLEKLLEAALKLLLKDLL